MNKEEYQINRKKSRGIKFRLYSKQLFLWLLLGGGVIVFNIDYIDIDVNLFFNKPIATEVKNINSTS